SCPPGRNSSRVAGKSRNRSSFSAVCSRKAASTKKPRRASCSAGRSTSDRLLVPHLSSACCHVSGVPGTPTLSPLVTASSNGIGCPFSTNMSSRSEEHTSELQSRENLECRLLLERSADPRYLHPFPTRRSSDLDDETSPGQLLGRSQHFGQALGPPLVQRVLPRQRSAGHTDAEPAGDRLVERDRLPVLDEHVL